MFTSAFYIKTLPFPVHTEIFILSTNWRLGISLDSLIPQKKKIDSWGIERIFLSRF